MSWQSGDSENEADMYRLICQTLELNYAYVFVYLFVCLFVCLLYFILFINEGEGAREQ